MKSASRSEFRGPGGTLPIAPNDLAARDLALLLEGETSGRPLQEVLEEFECARSVYFEKLRRYREGGLEGLAPRSPGPRGPWVVTREVLRLIVKARLRDPACTAESIAAALQRRNLQVSLRSVERALSELGLTRRALSSPENPPR